MLVDLPPAVESDSPEDVEEAGQNPERTAEKLSGEPRRGW